MKKRYFNYSKLAICLCFWLGGATFAQKTVGIGTDKPNPKAVLELMVENANTPQGLLLPRLTTVQRFNFGSTLGTVVGMAVYDITDKTFYTWDGTQWKSSGNILTSIVGIGGIVVSTLGNSFTVDGANLRSQWTTTTNGIFTNSFVGIGMSNPNALLQFPNINSNRKIVLHQDANNDFQNYGFGMTAGTLMYTVGSTGGKHTFYAGTSPTANTELMSIQGDGSAKINQNLTVSGLSGAAGSIVTVDGAGKLGIGTLAAGSQWTTSGTNIYYQGTTANTGFVGIGTNNPVDPLDLFYKPTSGSNLVGTRFNYDYSSISDQSIGLQINHKSTPGDGKITRGMDVNAVFNIQSANTKDFTIGVVTNVEGSGDDAIVVGVKSDFIGTLTGNNTTKIGLYAFASNKATTNIGIRTHATGATNNYAAIFDEGLVGIGTLTPNQDLTVVGNQSTTGIGYFGTISGLALNGAAAGSVVTVNGVGKLGFGTIPMAAASQWTTSGTNIYYQGTTANTGFVGIGTNNPTVPLQLNYMPTTGSTGLIGTILNYDYSNFNSNSIGLRVYNIAIPTANDNSIGLELKSDFTFNTINASGYTFDASTNVRGTGSGVNVFGVRSNITGSLTGSSSSKVGIQTAVNGFASTNIGIRASAENATFSYAAIFDKGLVGIGLTTPNEQLTVKGNTSVTGITYMGTIIGNNMAGAPVGSIVTVDGVGKLGFGTAPSVSQWISTTSGIYYTSNIAIGAAANPNLARVYIEEDATFRPSIFISGGGPTKSANIIFGRNNLSDGGIGVAGITTTTLGIATIGDFVVRAETQDLILSAKNVGGKIRFGTGFTETEKMTLLQNGNFGVGTNAPTQGKLVVVEDATINPAIFASAGNVNRSVNMQLGRAASPDGGIGIAGSLATFSDIATAGDMVVRAENNLILTTKGALRDIIFSTGASETERIRITNTGNVGIGTIAPGQRLTVIGNTSATGIGYFGTIIGNNLSGAAGSIVTVDGTGKLGIGTLSNSSQWATTTNGIYYNTGNVGIGTGSPLDLLHVKSTNASENDYISISSIDDTRFVSLTAGRTLEPNSGLFFSSGNDFRIGSTDNLNDFDESTATEYLRIKPSGDIGIGTTTPNQRLVVVGNTSITGIGYFSSISGLSLNGASAGSVVTVDGVGKLGFGALPASTNWKSTTAGVTFTNDKIAIGTSTVAGAAKFKVAGDGSMGGMVVASQSLINPISTSNTTLQTLISYPAFIPVGTKNLRGNFVGHSGAGTTCTFQFKISTLLSLPNTVSATTPQLLSGISNYDVSSIAGTWVMVEVQAQVSGGTDTAILSGFSLVVQD